MYAAKGGNEEAQTSPSPLRSSMGARGLCIVSGVYVGELVEMCRPEENSITTPNNQVRNVTAIGRQSAIHVVTSALPATVSASQEEEPGKTPRKSAPKA